MCISYAWFPLFVIFYREERQKRKEEEKRKRDEKRDEERKLAELKRRNREMELEAKAAADKAAAAAAAQAAATAALFNNHNGEIKYTFYIKSQHNIKVHVAFVFRLQTL